MYWLKLKVFDFSTNGDDTFFLGRKEYLASPSDWLQMYGFDVQNIKVRSRYSVIFL